ncbi:MAG TPA: CU044_5270 family protein [Mycobacteriales bacterium]|nr:CU044_5270 family protein [Mycobacteriales bacterium]
MDAKLTAAEQALSELRADLTGAPTDAMNRMQTAVLTRTLHQPAPVGPPGARPAGGRPHRFRPSGPGRRVLRPAAVAVAATAAVAVGVGTVAVATGDHPAAGTASQAAGTGPRPAPPRGGADPTGSHPAQQGPVTTVQQLLGRASLAADSSTLAPRDDQFVYSRWRSKVRPLGRSGLPDQLPTDSIGEYWSSADGSRPGWNVSVDNLGHPYSAAGQVNPDPSLDLPTYKFLTTLPTDPDRLLALIRQSKTAVVGQGKVVDLDQSVFETIGGLIHYALLPPGLAPALYQAAAKIPGVRIVRDTVDAAGRYGIGVFRSSARIATPGEAYAMMWIFDPRTYEFRGERLDIGTMSNSIALLQVAVVNQARRRPNGQLAPAATPHEPQHRGPAPQPPVATR